MKPLRFFALSMLILTTAACQTWDGLKDDLNSINTPDWAKLSDEEARRPVPERFVTGGNCPAFEVVEELGSVNEFSDVSDPAPHNLIAQAHIARVESACEYSGKTATADVTVIFEGRRGPRAQDTNFTYPFFVAVTDPKGKILAKEVFTANLGYSGGDNTTAREEIRQIIPIANPNDGPDYKILAGFQLDQGQLRYNRALIAARLAAEKARAEAARQAAIAAEKAQKAQPAGQTMMAPPQEEIIFTAPDPYAQPDFTVPQPQEQAPIIITPQ